MTIEDLVAIARDGAGVQLTKASEKRITKTRKLIEKLVEEEKAIYGVTTGFGALSNVTISKKDSGQLQTQRELVTRLKKRLFELSWP